MNYSTLFRFPNGSGYPSEEGALHRKRKPETMLLNCHTYFSHSYGTLSPERLVRLAADAGYTCLALTDINTTCAMLDFVSLCREAGVRPLLGIDFRNLKQDARCLYIGLTRSNEGIRELNAFLSHHLHTEEPFPEEAPVFSHASIIYPYRPGHLEKLRENEYLGLRPQDLTQRFRMSETRLREKAVALYPLSYAEPGDYYLHCLLRAIGQNNLLSKIRREDVATREEYFRTPAGLNTIYEPCPWLLDNTRRLMESCEVDFDFKSEKNKRYFEGSAEADIRLLRDLAYQGLQERYGPDRPDAVARLEKELGVIAGKNFVSYFLTAWDLVRYARSQGYFYAGRGSGANSIAAYCLRITDVDPIEFDLFFERFLNLHRASPPDFDIDFSWKDREDVTAYLFKRYGHEYTALLGAHSTYKFRAAVRELGKVYGLPPGEIARFEREVEMEKRIGSLAGTVMDVYRAKILRYADKLRKMPHHLTVHSSGLVVSEVPIHYYTATSLPPKGFPITHFDMYTADKFKLHKLDVLSQRGLGHIKDTIQLVKRNRDVIVDIDRTRDFMHDPHLNELLARGDTIGCFYIESPAMRQLLRKLNCDNYRTLVAASSVIRPGVAESGMAREYVKRHRDPSSYKAIHPMLDQILGETYGVMVYQEDIIKVAHYFAGLPLARADVLRRAMAWKFRVDDGFDQMEKEYYANCQERGYSQAVSQEVWRQMEGFAGFSFCKAHSASYAVESYQSLHLRTYYPLEFYVSVVNNLGGFYSTEFYLRQCQRVGGTLLPPCLNHSFYLTDLQNMHEVRLGFIHIKGLEESLALRIDQERLANGPFTSLANVWERLKPAPEQLVLLIRAGALSFTGLTKRQLLWEAYMTAGARRTELPGQKTLFPQPAKRFQVPRLEQSYREDALQELELFGFPICSRFELLENGWRGEIKSRDMVNNAGKVVTMVGYLHFYRGAMTSKGEYMQFGSFLDDENHTFEAVLFPQVYRRMPLLTKGVYAITGLIKLDFEVPSLEVQRWEALPISFDPELPRPEAFEGARPIGDAAARLPQTAVTRVQRTSHIAKPEPGRVIAMTNQG